MKGKVCIVTGSSTGIGYATALSLAKDEAQVVMVCLDEERSKQSKQEIIEKSGNSQVELIFCDLSELEQVRKAAKRIKEKHSHINVLINNAGRLTPKRMENSQGIELTFATNYLGHVLLTDLLLNELKAGAPSRIINVSSGGHGNARIDFDDLNLKNNFSTWRAYQHSKLAQLFFTYELAEQLQSFGITVNALQPGGVRTEAGKNLPPVGKFFARLLLPIFGISAEKGAKTTLYLATSSDVEGKTGKFFEYCRESKTSKYSYHLDIRKKLWEVTQELIKLK